MSWTIDSLRASPATETGRGRSGCAAGSPALLDRTLDPEGTTLVILSAHSARISPKTVWTFVRVRDDAGRIGWGEATLQDRADELHAPSRDSRRRGSAGRFVRRRTRWQPAQIWQMLRRMRDRPGGVGSCRAGARRAARRGAGRAAHDAGRALREYQSRHARPQPRGLRGARARGGRARLPCHQGRAVRRRARRRTSIPTRDGRRFDLGVERVLAVREAIGPRAT